MTKPASWLGVLATASLLLAACGGDPLDSGSADGGGESDGTITIGSADFSESQLIATIYSLALQDAGVDVDEQFNIGSREVYIQAVQDGSLDLVPDYAGSLMHYLDPDAEETTVDDVVDTLGEDLPDGLTMLDVSAAEDKDTVTVTQDTADQYDLTTISDLAPVASQLVVGGPPEWQTRVNGLVGLREVYGVEFASFLSLDAGGPLTLAALTSGQVQAGNIFSTDPALNENDLVALEDDKSLFASENVLPIIRTEELTDEIGDVLNGISAALTTEDLIEMNGRAAAGDSLEDVANAWLTDNGLI